MNKAQLIDALAQRLNGDKRVAADAVQGVVDIVVRAVEGGDHVTITGFGVFEKRSRAARVARNPRTGDTVRVAPTSVPAFRPGAQFKAVVSGEQKLTAGAPAVKRASAAKATAGSAPGKKTAGKKTSPAKTSATKNAGTKSSGTKTAAKKTAARKTSSANASADKASATANVPGKGKKTTAKKASKSKK